MGLSQLLTIEISILGPARVKTPSTRGLGLRFRKQNGEAAADLGDSRPLLAVVGDTAGEGTSTSRLESTGGLADFERSCNAGDPDRDRRPPKRTPSAELARPLSTSRSAPPPVGETPELVSISVAEDDRPRLGVVSGTKLGMSREYNMLSFMDIDADGEIPENDSSVPNPYGLFLKSAAV